MPGSARTTGRASSRATATTTGTQGWSGAGKFNQQLSSQKAFKQPNNPQSSSSSSLQVPEEHRHLMTRKSYQDIFQSIKPDDATQASLGHFANVVEAFQRSGGSRTSTNGMHELLIAAGASAVPPQQQPMPPAAAAAATGRRRSNARASKKAGPGPISLPEQLQVTAKQLTAAVAAGSAPTASPLVSPSGYSSYASSPTSATTPRSSRPGEGKKESRLEKNRLAAKECRRKKKEYVKDLEDKVKRLEARNEELLEQLMQAKNSLSPAERRNLEARSQHLKA
eukprot:m.28172 g.28172  ORF g.28172 m.28172 type:complete len:281 (-) comp6512_c0_seq1:201-1043(-)